MEAVCDPLVLQDYLFNDLRLWDCPPNDPRGLEFYKDIHSAFFIMQRIRALYHASVVGHTLVAKQRMDANKREKNLPLGMYVDGSIVDYPHHLNEPQCIRLAALVSLKYKEDAFLAGHLSLVVQDHRHFTFAIWDPAGLEGMSLYDIVVDGVGDEWQPLEHADDPQVPLQTIMEPPGGATPGGDVTEDGLCAVVSTLVLVCALRFQCFDLWRLSGQIAEMLTRMQAHDRQRFTRNAVVLYRRTYAYCHGFEDLATLLGIYHRDGRDGRLNAPLCGVVWQDPQTGQYAHCTQSTASSRWAFCADHKPLVLNEPLPPWPSIRRSDAVPMDADAFNDCMFTNLDGTRCDKKANPDESFCFLHRPRTLRKRHNV